MTYQQKQAEDFIQRYGLIVGGLLIALPLLFFGYQRIQIALRLVEDQAIAHSGRLGLLFMAWGCIVLGVLLFVTVIRRKKSEL